MSNVKGKVVVITGASSGIGESTARLLAQHGAHVVIGARRMERLEALASSIRLEGGSVEYHSLDVTRLEEMHTIVDLAQTRYGHIDVILNNAGVMPLSPLEALKVDEWNRMMDVNIRGVLHGITLVSPGVTESELADTISDEEARDLMKEYRRISIPASAIAQSILFAISQPAEVDVNEIVVRPTASMA